MSKPVPMSVLSPTTRVPPGWMSLPDAVVDELTTLPIPPVTFLLTLGVAVVAVVFLAVVPADLFAVVAMGSAAVVGVLVVAASAVSLVVEAVVDVADSLDSVLVGDAIFPDPPRAQAATTKANTTKAANWCVLRLCRPCRAMPRDMVTGRFMHSTVTLRAYARRGAIVTVWEEMPGSVRRGRFE